MIGEKKKVVGDFRIQGIFGESCQWGGGCEEGSVSVISKQLRGSGRDAHREVVMCALECEGIPKKSAEERLSLACCSRAMA